MNTFIVDQHLDIQRRVPSRIMRKFICRLG